MKLELAVDRIEGDRVVLIDQDQNVYVWPKKVLPDGLHEGQLLMVELSDAAKSETGANTAKDILNEILKLE
jgi:hypothetical protein